MDAARLKFVVFILFSALVTAGCQAPYQEQGSHEFRSGDGDCFNQAIQNQFIVKWKDGHTSVEKARDQKEFKNKFMKDHHDDIDYAENDYVVSVPKTQPSDFSAQS